MTTKETLARLINLLGNFEYTILDFPLIVFGRKLSTKVLLAKTDLHILIDKIKQLPGIESIQLSSNNNNARVNIALQNRTALIVDVFHEFKHNRLGYLSPEEVMQVKREIKEGVFLPSYEHQLEFAVLGSFLAGRGLEDGYFKYFNEMHFLIQDDLLDNFNRKFNTNFSNLYSLTIFSENQKQNMIKVLKTMPYNSLFNQINVRWHNFLGVLRQAKLV